MSLLKSLCALTLTLSFYGLSAQNLYDNSFIDWDKGPIKWSDFQVSRTPDDAKYVSGITCIIFQEVERTKVGNYRFPVLKTTTRMNKLASWYDPDKCTDWTLRYEQTRFDILEVMRRRLQNSFNRNFLEPNLDAYYDQLISSTVDTYDRETNYGKDTLMIMRYEEMYRQELDTLKLVPAQVPVFETQNFALTFNTGLAFEKFGTSVSGGVPSVTGFQFGFGMLYKKLSFGFDFTLGFAGKLRCDNFYHDTKYVYEWAKGKGVRGGNLNINGGFRICDDSNLAITPLVGIGVTFLDQTSDVPRGNNSESFENSEVSGFRTQAGLAVDWKVRKSLNTYAQYTSDYTETKIRFAITGVRTNFKSLGPTYSINASITFVAESWFLK